MTTAPLDEIYRSWVRYVWASLQRLGVASADVEDVAHEVFLTIQRRLPSFEEGRALRPWIFGICAKTVANYRRSAYRRREELRSAPEDALDSGVTHSRPPDEEVSVRQRLQEAQLILERLSPVKRAVFVMFEVEGKSCVQIADELGLPEGTVYSRLSAARKQFEKEASRRMNLERRAS